MLARLIATILISSTCLSLLAQTTYSEVNRKSLSDILKIVEARNDVSFSYDDNKVAQFNISYKQGKYELDEFLDLVFEQTSLGYEYVDNNHIIVVGEEELVATDDYNLCGYLKDFETKEMLPFATILSADGKTGTSADDLGYFEISKDKDIDSLLFSYLGYEELLVGARSSGVNKCENYYLRRKVNYLDEIEVIEYLDDGITLSQDANSINIAPSKMNMLPGNVDKDVLASVQFLPGVTSPNESLNGLHIRGGTPDQNLVLWDDIPIYHVSHMFGAVSAFNPFMVDRVNVHRNGISSRYGGKVSGVIEIDSRSQKPDKLYAGAGANMLQAHGELAVPILKRSALFLSMRFSLAPAWQSAAFLSHAQKVFQGTDIDKTRFSEIENQVFFTDFALRYIYENDKNEFDFSFIANLTDLIYNTDFNEAATANDNLSLFHGGSKLGWKRKWSDKLKTEVAFTGTGFTKDYSLKYLSKSNGEELPFNFISQNNLQETTTRLDVDWDFAENKKINFGYQYIRDSITIEISRLNFERESRENELFQNELHALYGDYEMIVPNLLQLKVGLRYQYSASLKNEYFAPRISLTSPINRNLTLKLSTSKSFQFISQLVSFDTNQLGFENELWIAANNDPIPVIESNQWTGGLLYTRNKWTVDFDAYVKELTGLTSFSDSFDPNINLPYSTGTARISGIDLMVKRRFQSYKTWMSYSFSKANYEFLNLSPESFSATFDQRHVFQWVHMYNANNWNFSLGLTAKSGLPYSLASGIEANAVKFANFNSERLDSYLRLDMSVVYNYRGKGRPNSYFALSLQNILNRNNLLSRRYLITRDDPNQDAELVTLDLFGLGFTPNVSANISF